MIWFALVGWLVALAAIGIVFALAYEMRQQVKMMDEWSTEIVERWDADQQARWDATWAEYQSHRGTEAS